MTQGEITEYIDKNLEPCLYADYIIAMNNLLSKKLNKMNFIVFCTSNNQYCNIIYENDGKIIKINLYSIFLLKLRNQILIELLQ
jgi:hypothetical protein